jgi:hypothetical protein
MKTGELWLLAIGGSMIIGTFSILAFIFLKAFA